MTIHWKAVEQYFTVVLFVFQVSQLIILENLSYLDLALSGVKGLEERQQRSNVGSAVSSDFPGCGLV